MVSQVGSKAWFHPLVLPLSYTVSNPRVSMGSVEGRQYQRFVVLEENVRRLWQRVETRAEFQLAITKVATGVSIN